MVKQPASTPQSGFAMIVVLASLLILTTLFAIATFRSMTHIQVQTAERHLATRHAHDAVILQILRDMRPDDMMQDSLQLPPPFDDMPLRAQDVGGLIDLNTAAPELLHALFDVLDFPPDAVGDFRQWRREGRRLNRLDDIIRITGADILLLDELDKVATVFSGRRGIAPMTAPLQVRTILDVAAGGDPDSLTSPPSGTNFAIYRGGMFIGVVSLGGPKDQSRILELR